MDVSEDDLLFVNEHESGNSVHTNDVINHSKIDFAINTIFSNINPNNSSQTNKGENPYQINNDNFSNQNPTEVSSQQEQILSKKVKRKQKSIEEIRQKNRERTKKSREKRIRDILVMVKQIEILKKEIDKLTTKISKLCPKCQQIMNSEINCNKSIKSSTQDDTLSSSSDTPNTSLVTNNLSGRYQSFTRKMLPLFTVIGLICLISSITLFYFDSFTSRNLLKQNNQIQGTKKRRLLFEKNYSNDTIEDKYTNYSPQDKSNDYNFMRYQCGNENKKDNDYDCLSKSFR